MARFPSQKARTETSSPSKNSSITTSEPATSPKILSSIICLTAFFASSTFVGIITPFPAAKPDAYILYYIIHIYIYTYIHI
jgi:hypothetical protein